MKFAVLVVGAAALGVVATVAIPSDVLESGTAQVQALGDRIGEIKLVDLNPLRAIYDWEMERIKKPLTPEEMGFHGSAVTFKPFEMPRNDFNRQFNTRGGYSDVGGSIQQSPH